MCVVSPQSYQFYSLFVFILSTSKTNNNVSGLDHRVLFIVYWNICSVFLVAEAGCSPHLYLSPLRLARANCFICSLLPDIGGGGLELFPITLILQHYINHSVIVITQSFLSIFSSCVHDGLNVKWSVYL